MVKRIPIKRPDKTTVTTVRGYKYVYYTKETNYSKELKRTVPNKILIGKLNDEGLMIPNDKYYEIFNEIEYIDFRDRADSIAIGNNFIINKVVNDITSLKKVLSDTFDDESKVNKILDIASYMIVSENNTMTYFEDYGYNSALFNKNIFTDTTIGNLFKEIKFKEIDLFINNWVKNNKLDKVYISYDSTNMNTTAGSLTLREKGHPKDDPDELQINMSLGYEQTHGIPLFYELFPGSMIDNNECSKMVERCKYYGIKDIGFILDRGYFSYENIKYFEKNNYDYILMCKGVTEYFESAFDKVLYTLKEGYEGYLEGYDIYGTTETLKLFNTNKYQYVHIFYNPITAAEDKLKINQHFIDLDKKLEELKESKIKRKEDLESFNKYYSLKYDDNGYFISFKRKDNVIKKSMKYAGFFSLISSNKLKAKEVLDIYHDRDSIEKIFRMDKSYLGNDTFRVHSDIRLESKMFISFIALIIRNEIHKAVKPLYLEGKKEYTVPKVLRELNKLTITRYSNNTYLQRYKLTAKQKIILKQFGLSETDYNSYAKSIAKDLNPKY